MSKEKYDAIQGYLESEFPQSNIEQANISSDQHYRIPTKNGLLMLKVGELFIEDHSQEEIIKMLKNWRVSDLLREHSKLGILVTSNGPQTFKRS